MKVQAATGTEVAKAKAEAVTKAATDPLNPTISSAVHANTIATSRRKRWRGTFDAMVSPAASGLP
jgi:hypothetical protein